VSELAGSGPRNWALPAVYAHSAVPLVDKGLYINRQCFCCVVFVMYTWFWELWLSYLFLRMFSAGTPLLVFDRFFFFECGRILILIRLQYKQIF
jgi:hypothetical protein